MGGNQGWKENISVRPKNNIIEGERILGRVKRQLGWRHEVMFVQMGAGENVFREDLQKPKDWRAGEDVTTKRKYL